MRVGSLFSGVGGIELGFERVGFKTAWFIECDKYARRILKKNFPNAKIYGDIKKIDFKTIPKVEILTGGFPCQDISNAGKRDGIEGSRSSLWKYFFKAIGQIRPEIAFIENVSALLRRGLDVVLADLAQIGYDAEWHCISASSVGANHQRDRIFIIATRTEDVAHTMCIGNSTTMGLSREQWEKKKSASSESICPNTKISNTNKEGLQRKKCEELQKQQFSDESSRQFGFWSCEPRVDRVVDGIPNRVDRMKCLGNAVVPQCAEVFANSINEVKQMSEKKEKKEKIVDRIVNYLKEHEKATIKEIAGGTGVLRNSVMGCLNRSVIDGVLFERVGKGVYSLKKKETKKEEKTDELE